MELPSTLHWTRGRSAKPDILRLGFFVLTDSMELTIWVRKMSMGFSVMSGRRWISFGTMKMSSPKGQSTGVSTMVIPCLRFFTLICVFHLFIFSWASNSITIIESWKGLFRR